MKRFGLSFVVVAALALVLSIADSADAAVRRVYAAPRSRVYVVNPVRPIYRPHVVIAQPVGPVIYGSPWGYNSAVIVRYGSHVHLVPAAQPIWSPIAW
jgi:hypothetical protein